MYTPVEILSNHRQRLLKVVEDHGPVVAGLSVFPNYLFLGEKPPAWFWGFNGVVRPLKAVVTQAELSRAGEQFEELLRMRLTPAPLRPPDFMANAIIEVRDECGRTVAAVSMFGRKLQARVVA